MTGEVKTVLAMRRASMQERSDAVLRGDWVGGAGAGRGEKWVVG